MATVTVEARNSKRRRQDELPIRPETATVLQAHLAAKHPGAAAFTLPRADDMADMLRRDLQAARETWLDAAATPEARAECERSTFLKATDDAGQVVDFHALRHSFCTLLARSGVHPRVMQAMARHSDPLGGRGPSDGDRRQDGDGCGERCAGYVTRRPRG